MLEAPYFDFVDSTVNGFVARKDGVSLVMPAFGTIPEVMCRLDAIYVYLRAEAAGILSTTDPIRSSDASGAPAQDMATCLGQ